MSTESNSVDNNNAEIKVNINHILRFFFRNKYFIFIVSFISIIIGVIKVNSMDKIWKGEFTIVLASEDKSSSASSVFGNLIAGNNARFALNLLDPGKGGVENDLVILKSPSVLMPIYEFVKQEKNKKGINTSNWKFIDWEKSVDVELVPDTTILKVSYKDKDQKLIPGVLEKISNEYQTYSVRDQNRIVAKTQEYLDTQIKIYNNKIDESAQIANDFGMQHNLVLVKGQQDSESTPGAMFSSLTTTTEIVEKANISELNYATSLLKTFYKNQNNFSNLRTSLTKEYSQDNIEKYDPALYKAGIFPANYFQLLNEYDELNFKLGNYSRFFMSNDDIMKNLEEKISNLENIIKKQTQQYLVSFISNKKSTTGISKEKYKLINRFKELHKMAIRDEITLNELLIQKRTLALKEAESPTPWEIITLPNTYDYPIAPSKIREIPPILFLGFSLSVLLCYLLEKKKGFVFHKDIIFEILKSKSLFDLDLNDIQSWDNELSFLFNRIWNKEKNKKISFILLGNFDSKLKLSIEDKFKKFADSYDLFFNEEISLVNEKCTNIVLINLSNVTYNDLYEVNKKSDLLGIRMNGIINFEKKETDFLKKFGII